MCSAWPSSSMINSILAPALREAPVISVSETQNSCVAIPTVDRIWVVTVRPQIWPQILLSI